MPVYPVMQPVLLVRTLQLNAQHVLLAKYCTMANAWIPVLPDMTIMTRMECAPKQSWSTVMERVMQLLLLTRHAMTIVTYPHVTMMVLGASREQNAHLESTETEHHVWTVYILVTHVYLRYRARPVVLKIVPSMAQARR